jgi:phosphomannomutase
MLIRSISGLRGIIAVENGFSENAAKLYARSFAEMLGNSGLVALGYDGRTEGKRYYQLIADALMDSGCDVLGLSMVPTPTVMFAVETHTTVKGGISVTASHNGQEWNGMKFISHTGLFLDKSENEKLWNIVDNDTKKHHGARGDLFPGDEVKLEHLDSIVQIPFLNIDAIKSRNFKIVLDAVNASGSFIVRELLTKLSVTDVIPLYADGSGIFPHTPEPVPQNLTELCEEVKRLKADLGIAVDPDADRCVFIMDNGEPFIEENTIVLAAEEVLRNNEPGQSVVTNLSTTRALDDIAEKFDAALYRTPVGEINVAKKMKSVRAIIGGEGSGGVIYPEIHTGRDSLVAIALALNNLAFSNTSLSEKKKSLPQYEIVKSKINLINPGQVQFVLDAVKTKLAPEAKSINEEDGIRFDFEKSWLHIRPSNTEPIIRLIAEAPTREEAEALIAKAK